jgi:hypothetical protein
MNTDDNGMGEKCPRCDGTGRYPSSLHDGVCFQCDGLGRINVKHIKYMDKEGKVHVHKLSQSYQTYLAERQAAKDAAAAQKLEDERLARQTEKDRSAAQGCLPSIVILLVYFFSGKQA